ncbi:MAG: pyridoxine 5'-phosphate synthase [Candidatus Hydrogenedentota bacterium]|nr:MAG: pyridoxine 5'-phosphate synthase [Candidatus Hydrogenedentota bacterium]
MRDRPIRLGVNIDHVATLRQARREGVPDILEAAEAAMKGGADGITMHLREDRRHVQDEDLPRIASRFPLNLEMAATEEMTKIALKDPLPVSACLVPERREELTTEGGLDVAGNCERIATVVRTLKGAGIRVSLFIDPDPIQVEAAASVNADAVELHTGRYARTPNEAEREVLRESAAATVAAGLHLHAGHGLDLNNVGFVAALPDLEELNIGFSIVARAVFVGLEEAVREMRRAIDAAEEAAE